MQNDLKLNHEATELTNISRGKNPGFVYLCSMWGVTPHDIIGM